MASTNRSKSRTAAKAKMQSAKLQYTYPDENVKGTVNRGVIAQYPYFAPDRGYMKKAPKMTKADELYLRKFMAARDHKNVARIDRTNLADRQYYDPDASDDEAGRKQRDGPVNVEINVNSRLFLERNKHLKPDQVTYRSASGEKVTLTSAIFGEKKYFQQREDTTQDQDMQQYVEEDWQSSAFVGPERKKQNRTAMTEQKGRTGNVVPFFPSEWKKNANDVFNLIMNGQEGNVDNTDETLHAAIYKKVPELQSVSQFLPNKQLEPQPINGERPTSGKHFARERKFEKRKGELEPPNPDPFTSSVAINFEKSKRVEGLLNRLANYMAGEIPDVSDLGDLFPKDKQPQDDGTTDPMDDATTNYTKDEPLVLPKHQSLPKISLEPIYAPPVSGPPPNELNASDTFIDPPPQTQEEELEDLGEIPEEEGALSYEEEYLPDIYASAPSRNFKAKTKQSVPKKQENLFIYKDFDTSLTKVKNPVTKLPLLQQTTSQRGEDLIRDRLLSFQVKNGQLSKFDRDSKGKVSTINERSGVLAQKRKQELLIAQLKSQRQQAQNMKHKAFWVHNSQSASAIPLNPAEQARQASATPQPVSLSEKGKIALATETNKRINESYDPIPIKKDENITSPEKQAGAMKLVQQYVMVRGRLQPALKYIAPNPMYNRYQVKGSSKEAYEEIVTYPTVSGDLKMKNRHVGVNYDDRDIPVKQLPNEAIEGPKESGDLEQLVTKLQKKNVKYNKDYYSQVQRKNFRAIDRDDIDDPRSIAEIEQENVDLKEQYIHQMMTLEQYLQVAYMWFAEQDDDYNPYDSQENFNSSQKMWTQNGDAAQEVQFSGEGVVAQDGWVDYRDDVNKVETQIDVERHKEKFDMRYVESQSAIMSQKYKTPKKLKVVQDPLVLPSQVKTLGTKIKNLFYKQMENSKQTGGMSMTQSASTKAFTSAKKQKQSLELNHYGDFEYHKSLQVEVDQLRMLLEADFKNQRIIDLENKVRDNKRIIVNLMIENIFQLRFGFDGNQKAVQKLDRDELLTRMLQSRLKRIRIVERLIKISNERKTQLNVWGIHSDLIDWRKKVRVVQDIVILLQEKNLLFEIQGRKNYIKVGEIERELDWPIRIRSKFGPIDAKDYYSRKLRTEIDEHNALLNSVIRDFDANMLIAKEMKAFISAVFGNDGWIKLVEARWLRNKQHRMVAEYDPSEKEQVPIYVKSSYTPNQLPQVPRVIRDELPTHGIDQFGGFHSRSRVTLGIAQPQQASRLLHEKLYLINQRKNQRSVQRRIVDTQPSQTIAKKALKGQMATNKQIMSQRVAQVNNRDDQTRQDQQVTPNDEIIDPYGLAEKVQLRSRSKEQSINNSFENAGAILDASFHEGSVNVRTENQSMNGTNFGSIEDGKPLDLKSAKSQIGFQVKEPMTVATPAEPSKPNEAQGDKQLTTVVKEEINAQKEKERQIFEQEFNANNTVRDQQPKPEAAKAEKVEESKEPPKQSNWLQRIRQEQIERDQRAAKEKEERAARLKALLDSDDEDNEETFDYKGLVGDNLKDFLSKIENHIKAEQVILDAWNEKDGREESKAVPHTAK